jgi:hypothetical protein
MAYDGPMIPYSELIVDYAGTFAADAMFLEPRMVILHTIQAYHPIRRGWHIRYWDSHWVTKGRCIQTSAADSAWITVDL